MKYMMNGLIGENIILNPHHEIQLLPSLFAIIPSEITQAHPHNSIRIINAIKRSPGLNSTLEGGVNQIQPTKHKMVNG